MPWLIAKLRGKEVYARCTPAGELVAEGGRVEIRYHAHDGRLYRAGARNLEVVDGDVLPDDTCSEAEAVERAKDRKSGGGKGSKKKATKAAAPPSAPREGEVVAYTDGACSGNPGPAGLGVVVLAEPRIERFEYLGEATNNVAELTAILRALEEIDASAPAAIYTDSRYAIGVLTKGWKAKANKELIASIKAALEGRTVRFEYVPGHAGIELNERADELAREAISARGSGRMEKEES